MNFVTTEDVIGLYKEWYAEAEKLEPNDANAMVVATASANGAPSARMVLLKDVDEKGFVFYTNRESRKGSEIAANPRAALLFHWKSIRRQVRVEGPLEPVSEEEADAYFASRPRPAQIGAWASNQSQTMEGRFILERRVAEFAAKFHLGKVSRPPFWSGFRLRPLYAEFWKNHRYRLHDRTVYERDGDAWTSRKIFP